MSIFSQKLQKKVQFWQDFYRCENDRPLLGFFIGSEYPLHRYQASASLSEQRPLKPEDFSPADYVEDCENIHRIHQEAGGDSIWAASAFWGIPWLEAMLGCPIWADHESGSIHSEKPQDFKGPDDIPQFDPKNEWALLAKDFLQTFARASDGRYPLATTRMRGISDMLSALYGGENLVFAIMERPQEIRQSAKKLAELYVEFAKFQLRYIPEFHGGIGSFYYNAWAPKGTVWHQEDAAALLSPQIYRDCILPFDKKIYEKLGGGIMHMHPTGYYPYRELLDTNLAAMELHIDQGGPSAKQLFEVHKEILQSKPLIIWGQLSDEDLDWLLSSLGPQGLALQVAVDSPGEARLVGSKISKYLQKF